MDTRCLASDLSRSMRTCQLFLQVAVAICLTACKTTSPAFPPKADIVAVTEAKPQPTAAILTDPAANDRYNSEVEAAFDRIRAAGVRICRFEKSLGMDVTCP